jgi:hypothetical protein
LQVQDIIGSHEFWRRLQCAIKFLQPFSDFIHQVEGDTAALRRVYYGLMKLDKHVHSTMKLWSKDAEMNNDCDNVLRTWERRLDGQHGGKVAQLLFGDHVAAYLLDPLYAVTLDKAAQAPHVCDEHEDMAKATVKRIGGTKALREFEQFLLCGWNGSLCSPALACANTMPAEAVTGHECAVEDSNSQGNGSEATQPARAALVSGEGRGIKRKRVEVASVSMRKGVWKRYGVHVYPKLAKVALRLLSAHPTSCASERNWSLWGRVYTAARNALGLKRAKKLITFCFNDRSKLVNQSDFNLLLETIEGIDKAEEEAPEQMDKLRTAANEALTGGRVEDVDVDDVISVVDE